MAAEIGTKKVITEHSTIGLVVTTDGSISDIPRAEYEEAEERVINELKEFNKPFVVLLNCLNPESEQSTAMANQLSVKYNVPVMAVNCLNLNEQEIKEIITQILFGFPVKEIGIDLPLWLVNLPKDHWLKSATYQSIMKSIQDINYVRDISTMTDTLCQCEYITDAQISSMDLSIGSAWLSISMSNNLFYKSLKRRPVSFLKMNRDCSPVLKNLQM
jgi:stage IV sporulation protein A